MNDPGSSGPLLGAELELRVGAPAHGGFCVARVDDDPHGRVVFVRHALPGEQVRVRVTEDGGGSYCRADAIAVLSASPDRVPAPCPYAGPGRCGGCDWQHVAAAAQRRIKAEIVREQLRRLAGLELDVVVEELPGGLLGWRTRTVYAVDAQGRLGLHRHRSHEVEVLDHCPLGVPAVGRADALRERWPGPTGVEVATGDGDAVSVLAHRPGSGRQARGRRAPDRVELVRGPATLSHRVGPHDFDVAAAGFWQVHPHAAQTFTAAVLDAARPVPGDVVLELYAGAGMLTAAVADRVGPTGRVVGLESSRVAVADAARNLAELPWAEVRAAKVTAAELAATALDADLVILDPPRSGAGPAVVTEVLMRGPRAVCYVACDPAALARDLHTAFELGWRLTSLRAFDAFPMTHHVECVALLEPGPEIDPPVRVAGEALRT